MILRAAVVVWLSAALLTAGGCTPSPGAVPGATGVFGRVAGPSGGPAAAFVFAYRASRGGVRGAADFGIRTESDGSYFLDLVPGEYHLVARRRRDGAEGGPPRSGDAWSLYGGNPVSVPAGRAIRADFTLRPVTQPRLLRAGSLGSGDTGFQGRVLDDRGHPVAGAIVLGFPAPDYRQMPEFTSAPTDRRGAFQLFVPEGGVYCLAARTRHRGQPAPGELYGLLGEGARGCLTVEKGELRDVDPIVVRPFGLP